MGFLILILKGFLIGIAFIIPGLSGGTLAIYLGVYDRLLHSLGNILTEMKKSLSFLIPLFIGIALSVVLLAKLLGYLIDKNSFVTLMFFIGLVIGGLPYLYRQVKNEKKTWSHFLAFFISFLLVILLLVFKLRYHQGGISLFEQNIGNFILLLLLGFLASSTMIIPGVSGSALLMVLGFYTAIVSNVVGNITDFSEIKYHLFVLIPFGIGAVLGIIIFSKIIEYFLKNKFSHTMWSIIGFIVSSAIVIFFEIGDHSSASSINDQIPVYQELGSFITNHVGTVLLGILTLIIGIIISYANEYLGKKNGKQTA